MVAAGRSIGSGDTLNRGRSGGSSRPLYGGGALGPDKTGSAWSRSGGHGVHCRSTAPHPRRDVGATWGTGGG